MTTVARPAAERRSPDSTALEGADLRDLSTTLAETSGALAYCLLAGDVDAAERLFDALVEQLPDRRSVITDVLAPLIASECQNAPSRRARDEFVHTCAAMIDRVRTPALTSGVAGVRLSASCICPDALMLEMTALLLDDLGVPTTFAIDGHHDAFDNPLESCGLPVLCLAICDPSRLPDSELLIRSLRLAGTAVVLAGNVLRDEPGLAALMGASAGSWHAGHLADLVLRLRGPLSAAEAEVLSLAASGCTNVRIAHELGISVSGVKARLESAYAKVHAADRAHAVAIALRQRWIR